MPSINIVIPIYNERLSADEFKSLSQCFKLLCSHSFTFICQHDFNHVHYTTIADQHGINYKIENFEGRYFKNIEGYNLLLLSPLFYERFTSYDYILIYQLDSYIFFDSLAEWCSKGFDYVAAPWIGATWLEWTKKELLIYSLRSGNIRENITTLNKWLFKGYRQKLRLSVGNGGFSLRKVDVFLRISAKTQLVKLRFPNEDVFWSIYVPLNFDFKVPEYKTAAGFSFDLNPDIAYGINHKKLPMGCHAWCRTDHPYEKNASFWKNLIE